MPSILLFSLVAVISFYIILIAIAFHKDRKLNKSIITTNKATKSAKQTFIRIKTSWVTTLITVLSLFAAYDLFGDVYFLLTFSDLTAEISFKASCGQNYQGIAFCINQEPKLCSPMEEVPLVIDPSDYHLYLRSKNHDSYGTLWGTDESCNNVGYIKKNDGVNVSMHIFGGYTCNELFNDKLYPDDNQLYEKYDICLNAACKDCQNQCVYGISGYFPNETFNDWTYTIPIYSATYSEAFITCHEKTTGAVLSKYFNVNLICMLLLGLILFKEVVKILFVLAYFFSKTAQHSVFLKISMNSPLTAIFAVTSERFRNDILSIKKDDSSRRTLGLILDLVFEDIPQLFLPFWSVINLVTKPAAIISISGSLIMVCINLGILISNLYKDYKSALSSDSNTVDVQTKQTDTIQVTTQIQKNQHEQCNGQTIHNQQVIEANTTDKKKDGDSFKEWFYKNIDLNKFTDECYAIFLDQHLNSFVTVTELKHSELKEIGIEKLGDRKVIVRAIQKLNT